MKHLLIVLALSLSTAFAAEVDLKKSSFKWLGTKVTGKHFGTVSLKKASVDMNKDKLSGGNFVIDLNTINVTDLEGEWKQKLEGHLKNDDFFNVPKFPTATLKVNKVDGKNIHGDLTIKGKTQSISFPYKKKGKTYEGTMKFDRTKFGMVYKSGNFFKDLGDKIIHDEIKVDFKVVLK